MPSWNEKPVVVPTVNVNLTPCTTAYTCRNGHLKTCPGAPILIPLPLEPFRSVTFTVRLGECWGVRPGRCVSEESAARFGWNNRHSADCPGRPIRVSCSISGKTWEESEVTDAWPDREDGYLCSTAEEFPTLLPLCRERWGFIKSFVLGHSLTDCPEAIQNMRAQRDAVFAALADMARARKVFSEANARLPGFCQLFDKGDPTHEALARYVEHLVEQVGVLP